VSGEDVVGEPVSLGGIFAVAMLKGCGMSVHADVKIIKTHKKSEINKFLFIFLTTNIYCG
jgi:hypothetical protein